MNKERRRHKRYCVTGLRNRLLKPRFLGLFIEPTSEEYPCLDISESGLQFISKRIFNLQSRILFNITTPSTRNHPIRVKAKVVWLKRSFDLSFCLVGTNFVSLSERHRNELKMLLEKAGKYKEEIPQHIQTKMIKEASVCIKLPPIEKKLSASLSYEDLTSSQINRKMHDLEQQPKVKKGDIDWKG